MYVFQQIRKTPSVFGNIHIVIARADDFYPCFVQVFGKFQGSLTTQLHNYAFGLFEFNNLQKMFPIDRLEIEFICHVKIRRNSFWVTIDHNCLITRFFYRQKSVNAAIIKLNALPNPIRTRA